MQFLFRRIGFTCFIKSIVWYDVVILSSRKLHLANKIHAKLVVATSCMTLQESLKAYNAGASDYIVKNLDPDWLKSYLAAL